MFFLFIHCVYLWLVLFLSFGRKACTSLIHETSRNTEQKKAFQFGGKHERSVCFSGAGNCFPSLGWYRRMFSDYTVKQLRAKHCGRNIQPKNILSSSLHYDEKTTFYVWGRGNFIAFLHAFGWLLWKHFYELKIFLLLFDVLNFHCEL